MERTTSVSFMRRIIDRCSLGVSMADDATTGDFDAAAKAAASAAVAARSIADEAKAAASTAADLARVALEKANAAPADEAAKAASDSAAADVAAKATAAKTADDQAIALEAAANDAAAKAAAAKALPPDLPSKPSTQVALVAQPAAPIGYFDLLKAVVIDPKLTGTEKELLLAKLKGMSPTSDRWTFRWAIWILGALAMLTVVAIWMIALLHDPKIEIPAGLVAIGSGAAGALAGLLNNKGSDQHS